MTSGNARPGSDRTAREIVFLLAAVVVIALIGVRIWALAFPNSPALAAADMARVSAPSQAMTTNTIEFAGLTIADPMSVLPVCFLRSTTGIACPTCGSTRALISLAHGRVLRALAWNVLATIALLGTLLSALAMLLCPGWWIERLSAARTILHTRVVRMGLVLALLAQAAWITLHA